MRHSLSLVDCNYLRYCSCFLLRTSWLSGYSPMD
nr:MAG TPA: hypothetical protein [Caudoviricetes sp.]